MIRDLPNSENILLRIEIVIRDFKWYTPKQALERIMKDGEFYIFHIKDMDNNIDYSSEEFFSNDAADILYDIGLKYKPNAVHLDNDFYTMGNYFRLIRQRVSKLDIYPDKNKIDFNNPPESYLRWHSGLYWHYYTNQALESDCVSVDDYKEALENIKLGNRYSDTIEWYQRKGYPIPDFLLNKK